jgi:Kef-type K+ transport system membrane component KefB
LEKQIRSNQLQIEKEEELRVAMLALSRNPERTDSDINEMIQQLDIVVEDHKGAKAVITKVVTETIEADGNKVVVQVKYVDGEDNEYIVSKRTAEEPEESTREEDRQTHDQLLFDICVLLIAMLVGGVCAHAVGLSEAVGYSLAGAVTGPFGMGYITQLIQVYTLTAIASIIVTFNVGLTFDFHLFSLKGRITRARGKLMLMAVLEFFLTTLVTGMVAPSFAFMDASSVGVVVAASTFYVSSAKTPAKSLSSSSSSSSSPGANGLPQLHSTGERERGGVTDNNNNNPLSSPSKYSHDPPDADADAFSFETLTRVLMQGHVVFAILAMVFIDSAASQNAHLQSAGRLLSVTGQFLLQLLLMSVCVVLFMVGWHLALHTWLRHFRMSLDQFMCLSFLSCAALMVACASISASGAHVGGFVAGVLVSVKGFGLGRGLLARCSPSCLSWSFATAPGSTAWVQLRQRYKDSNEGRSKTQPHPVADARAAQAESSQLLQMTADMVDGVVPMAAMVCALSYTATGMFIDLPLLLSHWREMLFTVLVIQTAKGVVTFALVRAMGGTAKVSLRYALGSMHAGEYAWIVCHTAVFAGVISLEHHKRLANMVLISQVTAPIVQRFAKLV